MIYIVWVLSAAGDVSIDSSYTCKKLAQWRMEYLEKHVYFVGIDTVKLRTEGIA